MKTHSDGRKFRVGIIGLFHESNTFIPEATTLKHFRDSLFLVGEEVRVRYERAHHEISGFFQTLAAADIEAVPIMFVYTAPWGRVDDATREALWQLIADGLDQAGPLDGILAAPHGAAVSASEPDMDGWWLSQLREKSGPETPIIATMDPHVNLSTAMVRACNALIAYRENPHLDQFQRGVEAATLMVRTLHGEIAPVVAGCFPPVVINIERQLTSAEPMLTVNRQLERVRALPGVLSASVAFGFPYADISDLGSAFAVVTDGEPDLAQSLADELGQWLIANRELFRGQLISPADALAAAESAPKPVGLLDMGDNMGGGAPGDSMILAKMCHASRRFRTLAYVVDAESVQKAREAGIGGKATFSIGGKLPMTPVSPLETEATVKSFHEGKFFETQPRHGGKTGGDMGPCAVVETDSGLTFLLVSWRSSMNSSAAPLLACGLNPADYDVVIIKGVHAPIGGYAEICPTLIRVNTPGVTSADMETLVYHHRRKPLFPFEEIA